MSRAFFNALVALDVALRPDCELLIRGQAHHQSRFAAPMSEVKFALRLEASLGVFYLACDGGYSRVVWSEDDDQIILTRNSSESTRARFGSEALAPYREAVNTLVRAALLHRAVEDGQ